MQTSHIIHMMRSPGFVESFLKDIQRIPAEVRNSINNQHGLGEDRLLNLLSEPPDYSVTSPDQPDDAGVIFYTPEEEEENKKIGSNLIESGSVAYCVMAGGFGTRVGTPKSLLRLPNIGMSLLSLKLFQAIGTGPIWIVVSRSLRSAMEDHIANLAGIDTSRISLLEQYESYRLTPDNQISFCDNLPDLYPCGHGDIFPILAHDLNVDQFRKNGGKYVSIVNVDNVLASLSPAVIGHHAACETKVTCEVVKKTNEDSGGILCNVLGVPQIIEAFRLHNANASDYGWLSTNSFVFDLDLDFSKLGLEWHRIKKIVDKRIVIQHERLMQEVTAAYDTSYLYAERSQRFMPIKHHEDIVAADNLLNANGRFKR